MGCNQCECLPIGSCAPFANKDDVERELAKLCGPCAAHVPSGTAPGKFMSVGFPNGTGECCEKLEIYMDNTIYVSLDCGETWILQGGATPKVHIEYRNSTPWSANGNVPTIGVIVGFDTIDYNRNDMFLVAGSSVVVPYTGVYQVSSTIFWRPVNTGAFLGRINHFMTKNGHPTSGGSYIAAATDHITAYQKMEYATTCSKNVYLERSNSIEIFAEQIFEDATPTPLIEYYLQSAAITLMWEE